MAEITTNAKLLYSGNKFDTLKVSELRDFVDQLKHADPDDELTVSFEHGDTAFTIEGLAR